MSRRKPIRDALGGISSKIRTHPTGMQKVQNASRGDLYKTQAQSASKQHSRDAFPLGSSTGFRCPGTALIFDSSVEIC